MKDINYIFYKTAQRSDMTILKPKKKKLDTDRWFDLDFKTLRNKTQKCIQPKTLSTRKPGPPSSLLRGTKAIQSHTLPKKAQFLQDQFEEIEKSINSNKFWDKWKLLYKSNQEDLAIQNGELWKNNFQ